MQYVLIAPDGEFMDGEVPRGTQRGQPNVARTQADGSFGYPTKPKGIGIYTLELRERFLARLAGDLPEAGTGPVVCKRLDGSSDFDVVITAPATTFDLQVSNATQVGGSASTDFLALKATSGDVIITAVFPVGTGASSRSIVWTGGAEVPGNPLQRRVSRTNSGLTLINARLAASGVTRFVNIYVARLTLDVDADRDGVVEQDAAGKNTWVFGAGQRGAIILVNNDDSNSDRLPDNENRTIDGANDVNDLAPAYRAAEWSATIGCQLDS